MKKDLFQTKYLLVVLIVFVVLGFTALLFQNNSKQPSKQTSSPTSTKQTSKGSQTPSTKSSDPTADWKIYTSEKYGYTFRYPEDYTVTESQAGWAVRVFPKDREKLPAIGNISYEMSIDYLEDPSDLTSAQCFDNYILELKDIKPRNNNFVLDKTNVEVGNLVGVQGTLNYGGAFSPDVFTCIANKGKVLKISFSKGSSEYSFVQDQEVIFNQILSTFKFTN